MIIIWSNTVAVCVPGGGGGRRRGVEKFAVAFGGDSLLEGIISTARRRGVPFTRVKGTKTRLGRCPKTPVAGCAGYGLIFDGSRKSIRTAHRIAPKVAAGASALTALRCPKKSSHYSFARFFRPLRILRLASSATGGARLRIPPPPFPDGGKGARMGGQVQGGSPVLGEC